MNALLFITLLTVSQAGAERPAETPVTDETEIAKLLHPSFLEQAGNYHFLLNSDPQKPLTLLDDPVLSWQGDQSWFGDVFVWTYNGRPELIGCVGSWRVDDKQRGMFHEFHSLARGPLSKVKIGTRYTWESSQPGVVLQEIAGATPPARTRRGRLLQMRALARDFSATLKAETGMQVLRMQSPIFRYGEECEQDGALFPFIWTLGTDPEVLLVVESRNTDAGDRWFFGAARFSWREAWLQHKGQEVWHARQYREQMQTKLLKEAYATIQVENISLADLRKNSQQTAADEAMK